MEENIIEMFGIPILNSHYCDVMEDGIQYKAEKWYLKGMEKYTNMYAVIGFDGSLEIWTYDGVKIFNGTLLDSNDFVTKLREMI